MDENPTSLILRFRDLVTSPNQTIETHAVMCDKGFVWWGWWGKSKETVPTATMLNLAKSAENSGLDILLFDSGYKKIYTAVCTKILWDNLLKRIKSPYANRTPLYYRDQKYLLWFKLEKLNRIPSDISILNNYTYVRVDEFFEDRTSRYLNFYGKQVSSAEELKQQDRSVWFVRPYDKKDPTNEIELLDSRIFRPNDFPAEYMQSESLRLLWLSDIHCCDKHHNFPRHASVHEKSLSLALEHAFKTHGIDDIAGVIVSGDSTWSASESEFGQASELFHSIMSWSKLQPYSFGICPGNHDIAFSTDPSNKMQAVTRAKNEARKNYESFYKNMFYHPPNEYLCCSRKFLLGNTVPVELVFLNSSLLDQKRNHFQGHGFVGQQQLELVSSKMEWEKDRLRRPFRIALLHHHMIPVTYREEPIDGRLYSVALDAEAIARWVAANKIDLVLHGHMHQPFYTKIERPLSFKTRHPNHAFHVAALGSTGVKTDHLGEIKYNTFAVLDFSKKFCELSFYTVDKINPSNRLASFEINGT